jgi:hypothetical protein
MPAESGNSLERMLPLSTRWVGTTRPCGTVLGRSSRLSSTPISRCGTGLVTIIILAVAVHLAWIAIAPTVPYAITSLMAVGVLGALYYRKNRW